MNKPLSNFLKCKRASISPREVGFEITKKRKVRGLTREEVAQLAYISTSWYTLLEQGKNINPSRDVLNSIAKALNMETNEKKYFLDLVKKSYCKLPELNDEVSNSFKKTLNELSQTPAIIIDRHFNLVFCNNCFRKFFQTKEYIRGYNCINFIFENEILKDKVYNLNDLRMATLSILKSYYGQYSSDTWYEEYIKKMVEKNLIFKSIWNKVAPNNAPILKIQTKNLCYNLNLLTIPNNDDLCCLLFSS